MGVLTVIKESGDQEISVWYFHGMSGCNVIVDAAPMMPAENETTSDGRRILRI